jgi:hypothetical protein
MPLSQPQQLHAGTRQSFRLRYIKNKFSGSSVELLRLILRGMRQRPLVILNPYVIPSVEIAAANVASEKVFGLADAKSIGALAEHRPAWSRFFE